ncbi:unnamed protein product [Arabis nemorensis]|uniref:Response regulatory domain-containing protein n=1 Tax=Arabis nemorensis TaxID=586526 RepID=A0A565BGQ4_9BRAS|nr:unnamed protein product [Arabis nemorensis]
MQHETSEIRSLLNELPTNVNILLVDSNLVTLLNTKTIMQQCEYEVTVYSDAEEARAFLTTTKQKIDIVVWDFHMPKVNGIEALKIGSERDLPVVIISDENQRESVMQATIHGACDYVMKPVSKEVIANMWQHIVRKRMMSKPGLTQPVQSDLVQSHGLGQDNDDSRTVGRGIDKEENWTGEIQQVQSDLVQTTDVFDLENYDFETIDQENAERNIDKEEENAAKKARIMWTSSVQPDLAQTDGSYRDNGEQNISKKEGKRPRKPRMTWTGDLHQKFLQAIEIVGGIEKANPMLVLKCLKEMSIEGLTRSNVASHLQKHRINLDEKRIPQLALSIGQSTGYRTSSLLGQNNDQFGRSIAYKPSSLLAPSNAHSSIPSYLLNDRASNPMINQNQYPNGYLTMNNNQFMTSPLPRLPYLDHPQQQQQYQFAHQMDYAMNMNEPEQYQFSHNLQPQHQQQYQFPHQMDYVVNKKEPEQVYGTDRELIYPNLPYDPNEFWMNG